MFPAPCLRDRLQQRPRVRVPRRVEQCAHRRRLDHPPRVHHQHPVAHLRHHLEQAGLNEDRWQERWRAARSYLAADGESGKRLTRYRLALVPQLAYLAHRTNQRIFQHLTVPQIIAQVLKEHGILADAHRFQLGPTVYPPERDYCVQYDETDLHFVQRLCEEEGLSYHFRHSPDGHLLVFGDDQTVFPKLAPVAYQQDSGLVADVPVIKCFGVRMETRPSRVTRRDYDFEQPRLQMEAAYKGDALPDLEDYDYPGRFTDRTRGKHLAKRALERHRADYQLAEGHSDQPSLVTGHFLALTDHPRQNWNDLWLLTAITHHGKQPQVLEESITASASQIWVRRSPASSTAERSCRLMPVAASASDWLSCT